MKTKFEEFISNHPNDLDFPQLAMVFFAFESGYARGWMDHNDVNVSLGLFKDLKKGQE